MYICIYIQIHVFLFLLFCFGHDSDFVHFVSQHQFFETSVSTEGWDKHQETIGLPTLPPNISEKDIIGATRKTTYTMPKTKFVKANKAYETATITSYNDHYFAIDMYTNNPDVPYGKTFIAHTKVVVYNNGSNSSHMACSVETMFPNGPPKGIGGWPIKNAMKNGSMEVFEKIGSSIRSFAECENEWDQLVAVVRPRERERDKKK